MCISAEREAVVDFQYQLYLLLPESLYHYGEEPPGGRITSDLQIKEICFPGGNSSFGS